MSHLSSFSKPWGKSFTDKRYLHPPFSENIVSMWPSSMILIGEISDANDPQTHYPTHNNESVEPSVGLIFTLQRETGARSETEYKSNHEFMPKDAVMYRTRKDGIPVHALTKDFETLRFHEEAFCDSERVSTAYVKVEIENAVDEEQTVELGLMVRSGKEFDLIGCSDPDGYFAVKQERLSWLTKMPPFERKQDCLTNGVYRLYFDKKQTFTDGNARKGENDLYYSMRLEPFERRSFVFALTRNSASLLRYERAKKTAISFWKEEIEKAKYIPDKNGVEPLFYNLLVQNLQMFARAQNSDEVIVRQGGIQRYMWPEARNVLMSLADIGGYSDYIDKALDTQFNKRQIKTGEDEGRIHDKCVPWISRTASMLQAFAYAATSDCAIYEKYIEQAMSGFRWTERYRKNTIEKNDCIEGLFPAGIASDGNENEQMWCTTDSWNLEGYEAMLALAEEKNSPYLSEIREGYESYLSVMKKNFARIAKEQKGEETIYVPEIASGCAKEEKYSKNTFKSKDGVNAVALYNLLARGVAGYDTEEAKKAIKFACGGGRTKNGLLYRIYASKTGVGYTWYTSWSEWDAFIYYQRCGNRKMMKKLVESQLKYNVTTEYYQAERYDDHDAYVTPWMPNGSANGRLLCMLFEYYGKRELICKK